MTDLKRCARCGYFNYPPIHGPRLAHNSANEHVRSGWVEFPHPFVPPKEAEP